MQKLLGNELKYDFLSKPNDMNNNNNFIPMFN